MTNTEIVSSYKKAEDKKKQVQILAELNTCDKETIIECLRQNGIDVEENTGKKRSRKSNSEKKAEANAVEAIAEKTDIHFEEEPQLTEEEQEQVDRALAIPFPVVQACTDRINSLTKQITEMENERRVLEDYLSGVVRND